MELIEAIKNVLDDSQQPREYSEEVEAVAGEDLLERIEKGEIKYAKEKKHNHLTEAEDLVARLIWDVCGKHMMDLEKFLNGFCYDQHPTHEIAMWLYFSIAYNKFMKMHPSENGRAVISSLCELSANIPPTALSGKRAREIALIWRKVSNGIEGQDVIELIEDS